MMCSVGFLHAVRPAVLIYVTCSGGLTQINSARADSLYEWESTRLRKIMIARLVTLSATILTVVAAAGGCASGKIVPPSDVLPQDSPELPMIALEGYRDQTDFFVKYRHGERIAFAGGRWRDRVALVESPAPAPSRYAIPSLVPMQYHQSKRWPALPEDVVSVPILDVEAWRLLREQLLRTVVPGAGAGLVVDFEHAEYFLYYDREGNFQATRLLDKPADYRVQGRLRFDEFMRRGRPILEAYLTEHGITATEFVFNTGDTGLYSLPFLYVNTERRLLVFVRNVPLQPGAVTAVPGIKGGQAFGHVLHSHLTNLYLRPVSSLHRLFFVVTDTAVSTVRFDWATGLSGQPTVPLEDAPPMDLRRWERDLDDIASRPRSSGTVDVLVDGEAFFTRFIDTVTSAKQSVHLQTYIFDNDDYAVRIAELLKRRSNEGVDVKVLLDGLGTITATMADSRSVPEHHEPPASVHEFLESDSRVAVRQKANPWFTGDHVKTTVVDNETAFVGGMNIGREYRYDWHDLMMEIRGPVVDILSREFRTAWAHAGPLGDLGYVISRATQSGARAAGEGYPLRVLLTQPGNYEIYKAQREAVRRAQRYIYIQNAYFTDDQLLRELVLARRRGVDVRVVIPIETDHGPITRSNVLAANLMLEHGIRVFLYPGFSHVKAAIFDGWVVACSILSWPFFSPYESSTPPIAVPAPSPVSGSSSRITRLTL